MSWSLNEIIPPIMSLNRFNISLNKNNLIVILSEYEKERDYFIVSEPEVESTFLKIYDVLDEENNFIGNVIKYRKMKRIKFGEFYICFNRYDLQKPKPINFWESEKLLFYEGENGCLLINSFLKNNVASNMIEII